MATAEDGDDDRLIASTSDRWPTALRRLLVGSALVAVICVVVGDILADQHRSEVAVELAKAGLQLGLITLVGALLTQGFKRFNDERAARAKLEERRREQRDRRAEREREERAKQADLERQARERAAEIERRDRIRSDDIQRERRESLRARRMAVLRDTVEAYHTVKTVRRALRAAGLADIVNLTEDSAEAHQYEVEMRALNGAELTLERIERELKAQADAFPHASEALVDLQEVQADLLKVLGVWESRVLFASQRDDKAEALTRLFRDFMRPRREGPDWKLWQSFNRFEAAIRSDLSDPALAG